MTIGLHIFHEFSLFSGFHCDLKLFCSFKHKNVCIRFLPKRKFSYQIMYQVLLATFNTQIFSHTIRRSVQYWRFVYLGLHLNGNGYICWLFWFKFIIGLLDYEEKCDHFKYLFWKIKCWTCLSLFKNTHLCILTKNKINFVSNHKRFSCYWLDHNCYLQRIIGHFGECKTFPSI